MLDLLKAYTVDQILIFIVLLAVALKGAVSYWEWGIDKLKKHFTKDTTGKARDDELESKIKDSVSRIDTLIANQERMQEHMLEIDKMITLLIESDKDDIKAWITQQHHFFCYQKGAIDDYSMDCIERRYGCYQDEGGNSFVAGLMRDLRELPRVSMTNNAGTIALMEKRD